MVERVFQELIGLPLSDSWRYLWFHKFEFGPQLPRKNRKGQNVTWADWGLVVEGKWSLNWLGEPLFRWCDFEPAWDEDEMQPGFYRIKRDQPVVESVEVVQDGSLFFSLTRGYRLEVRPRAELDEDDDEHWRLMFPENDPRGHLVLYESELWWPYIGLGK